MSLPLVAIACAVALAVWPGSAAAVFTPEITEFSLLPGSTQAGGHPDVTLDLEYTTESAEGGCLPEECYDPRNISTHFPTGFIGDPHVMPRCSLSDLNSGTCPVDSQLGIVYLGFNFPSGASTSVVTPLYNMRTRPDQSGLTAGLTPLVLYPFFLELSGRTDSDYGLDSVSTAIFRSGLTDLPGPTVELWGVPADPVHDFIRFKAGKGAPVFCETKGTPPTSGCLGAEQSTPAKPGIPPAPFLQNPTTCATPLSSSTEVEYYGGTRVEAQAPWPPMTGCQQLAFNPTQVTKPTTTRADTASGVDLELIAPLPQSATGTSPSSIRKNVVTLPEGLTINPNAADGKVACSDAETSIGTLFAAQCPEFAKIGTTEVNVAALPGPIFGGLYLGEPKPGEPYRLILTADGFATHVKLVGTVRADPVTGQLTARIDVPQANIQEVLLHFFGSERGLLATPEQCGIFEVANQFVPWDDELPDRHSTSFITIDSGPNGTPCPNGPRPFSPRLVAGTQNSTAGQHAPFSLSIERDDGDQNLAGLSVSTPPGFSATLKGIPYCPQAALDRLKEGSYTGRAEEGSSACPAASRIGSAVAGVGAGSHPLLTQGTVYLAGPYEGAPLSLVVVVPAVSGPYDLGNVSVRAAIEVDPLTAQVRTISDPLPQILEGIPLRTRFIQVNLDRPGFTLNPTNCEPLSIASTISADESASSRVNSHFQAANCSALPYGPKLALRLSGGLNRLGHPAIHAVFSAGPGEANTRGVTVILPPGELLDQGHVGTVCTKVAFAKNSCPAGSLLGRAEVATPILDQPLAGNVYLRSSSQGLPDLAIDLEGQVSFELVGRVDSVNQRYRTSFGSAPDVPISQVKLDLFGGAKGLLRNSESLCGKSRRASARMVGQNGAVASSKVKLQIPCGTGSRPHRHHRGGGHR